jgi:hypothetical protein
MEALSTVREPFSRVNQTCDAVSMPHAEIPASGRRTPNAANRCPVSTSPWQNDTVDHGP